MDAQAETLGPINGRGVHEPIRTTHGHADDQRNDLRSSTIEMPVRPSSTDDKPRRDITGRGGDW